MVYVAMYPAGILSGIIAIALGGATHNDVAVGAGFILFVAGLIFYIIGIFKIRDAMQDYYNSREKIGLVLSSAMTFFLAPSICNITSTKLPVGKKPACLPDAPKRPCPRRAHAACFSIIKRSTLASPAGR